MGVVRIFRHGPFHGSSGSGLWFGLFYEQSATSGVQLVGLFNGLAEFVVALDASDAQSSTPGFCRRSP